jgi:hypothetical protein
MHVDTAGIRTRQLGKTNQGHFHFVEIRIANPLREWEWLSVHFKAFLDGHPKVFAVMVELECTLHRAVFQVHLRELGANPVIPGIDILVVAVSVRAPISTIRTD